MGQERGLFAGLRAPPPANGRHQPPRASRRTRAPPALVVQRHGSLDGLGPMVPYEVVRHVPGDAPPHELPRRLDVLVGTPTRLTLKSSSRIGTGLWRIIPARLPEAFACLLLLVLPSSGCSVLLVVT